MSRGLGTFIDEFTSADRHIGVVNAEETDEQVADVLEYFERYEFTVTAPVRDEALPESFIVLSDGERCLAAIDVETLHEYLIDSLESGSFDERYASDPKVVSAAQTFLTNLDENVYSVEREGKIPLIEVSRVIEQQAGRAGAGTIHTGVQRLSRLCDERATWDTYVRIADCGTDVNLYGVPDWRPPPTDSVTVFAAEDGGTVADFWFVVYEGDDPDASGALVAHEVGPGSYTGFWTFESEYVREIAAYVETDLQPELTRLGDE